MKKCEKKEYTIFYFSFLSMPGTEKVTKDVSPGIFISNKMVANMKLAFTNVPFRHDLVYVIQKWLKFKRVVITFRLAHISQIFYNRSEKNQLLFSKSCWACELDWSSLELTWLK